MHYSLVAILVMHSWILSADFAQCGCEFFIVLDVIS
jgi:hypothetical protein